MPPFSSFVLENQPPTKSPVSLTITVLTTPFSNAMAPRTTTNSRDRSTTRVLPEYAQNSSTVCERQNYPGANTRLELVLASPRCHWSGACVTSRGFSPALLLSACPSATDQLAAVRGHQRAPSRYPIDMACSSLRWKALWLHREYDTRPHHLTYNIVVRVQGWRWRWRTAV